MTLTRIKAGRYEGWSQTTGNVVVEDTYDPSGAPHTRSVTLTRDRWLAKTDTTSQRFDTLREAKRYFATKE